MNREIKFRAWDIKGKRMLTPTLVNIKNKTFTAILEKMNKGNWNGNYRFDEVYFMQFTGLHDKNGAEIYEKDLMDCYYCEDGESKRIIGQVNYVGDCFYLDGIGECKNVRKRLLSLVKEVIGNIYENEDLLKQKDGN